MFCSIASLWNAFERSKSKCLLRPNESEFAIYYHDFAQMHSFDNIFQSHVKAKLRSETKTFYCVEGSKQLRNGQQINIVSERLLVCVFQFLGNWNVAANLHFTQIFFDCLYPKKDIWFLNNMIFTLRWENMKINFETRQNIFPCNIFCK